MLQGEDIVSVSSLIFPVPNSVSLTDGGRTVILSPNRWLPMRVRICTLQGDDIAQFFIYLIEQGEQIHLAALF